MIRKLLAALLSLALSVGFAACGAGTVPDVGESGTSSSAEKTEEELMRENPLFSSALPADQAFESGGISFRITNVTVVPSPNEANPEKTVKVFVDYPFEVKTVTSDCFSVVDAESREYRAVLPDGLDYMGPYRETGKDGRVSFMVPRKYDYFLLKAQASETEPVYVLFCLNDY